MASKLNKYIVIRHGRKGTKRFKKHRLNVSDILLAFGENFESAIVLINGVPATSDKSAKPGDRVYIMPTCAGT